MNEPIVHLVEGDPPVLHTACCNRGTWDFVEPALGTADPAKVTCLGPERCDNCGGNPLTCDCDES